MKNILFLFSIISLGLLSSCSNDDNYGLTPETPSTDTTKQKVVLSITNLDETSNLTRATTAETSVKKVIYAVFKTGVGVKSGDETFVMQDSISVGSTPVSSISMDLQPGKYVIAVFASGRANARFLVDAPSASTATLKDIFVRVNDLTSPVEFYGTTNIEVIKQSVNTTVTLQRVVGKVEIVIKDLNTVAPRINYAQPSMRAYTTAANGLAEGYFPWMNMAAIASPGFIYGDQPSPYNKVTTPRSQFAAHNESNPIVFYSLPTANFPTNSPGFSPRLSLYVVLLTAENQLSSEMKPSDMILITQDLKIYPNKITRYTGTIAGSNTQGFTMSVVDQWGTNTNIVIGPIL